MVTDDVAAAQRLCPACAEEVRAEAKVCRFCGHRFGAPVGAPESPKSECGAIALGLLLPSVGHFYVGESRRGRVILAAAILALLGVFVRFGVFAVPVVGIVSAVDAYRAVKIYNAGGEPRAPTGGIWALAGLSAVCVVAGAVRLAGA